ncbi:hypothetical protein HPB51_022019 [Rhipicephalus microplus]|uniref:Lipocal-1 1 n=1 Tax=Rhipicephalus microplus TaxID=6941 RepID=A0A9J6DJR5_RHIMP|nr:uncharacterized protein LOC119174556 [Rhipicephalus microplus]KAH8022137.1 hypothetical protein HPB51_022019 [Rhipicephalus microplus]
MSSWKILVLSAACFGALLGVRAQQVNVRDPELGEFQDDGKCFPLKQPWFVAFRNYEVDPFFGLAAKCVRFSPTDVPYVDNATHVKVEYGDHDSLDLSVQLVRTDGYHHQNALRVSPTGGAQVEIDLPIDYVDCSTCKIIRHPYAGRAACSLLVTAEHIENPPNACHFIYRLLCGATKIPIYDESCKKHH